MVAMTTVGSDYEERVSSSAVTPVGITIVVCTVIIRELLAHDQTIFFFFLYPLKCCVHVYNTIAQSYSTVIFVSEI